MKTNTAPARIYSPGYLYHDGIGIYVDADGYLSPTEKSNEMEITSDHFAEISNNVATLRELVRTQAARIAALETANAELVAVLNDIIGDLSDEYSIRARVYTDDEPLQAAMSSALSRAHAVLAKHQVQS